MRVVVTGADGFVGKHTVKALESKYDVVPLDLRGVNSYKVDITQDDLTEWIRQGDKVLHLAAIAKFQPAEENPQLAVRVNVEGTLNVLKSCLAVGAERLVYSSTGSVYSTDVPVPIREDAKRQPNTTYGLSKKMAEDWILHFSNGLPYVILRYGYIYGNGKDWGAVGAFLKKLSNNEQPIVYGGDQTNDFIYIKDIVQANLLALETSFTRQAYNIGTGRATSIKDVCEYCIKAMNSEKKMKLEANRTFDFPIFVYDINKARTLLHFEPEWNVLHGIKDMVESVNEKDLPPLLHSPIR